MDWIQLSSDYSAKYRHCYARITLEGHSIPEIFFLDEVEPKSKAPLLHFRNDTTGEIILKWDDSSSDIDWGFPATGLISYKGEVLMIRKRYDRQWKGGPADSTLNFYHLYHRINSYFVGNYLSCQSLQVAFQPRIPMPIGEGLKQLDTVSAVALSSEFAIGLPITNDEEILLFYHANPIGIINVDKNYIFLKETQFKQEFQDFIRQIPGVEKYEFELRS